MSLAETFDKVDQWKTSVYDANTGCEVARDEESEITFTMVGDRQEITHRFRDLMRGPCAGFKGAKLEQRIREVMEDFLRDAEMVVDYRAVEEEA